jgi:V/A-type H+-transporting ATPase subunit K
VDEPRKKLKMQITLSIIVICAVMAIIGSVFCTGAFAAGPSESEIEQTEAVNAEVIKFGLIAAAIAFGLGAIGAGFAISHVGAAAMGAVAEKPQIAGQALIFVALAEGIVVFGFITALMILGKV